MLANQWLALLKEHGGPQYSVAPAGKYAEVIHSGGAPFMIPQPEMFDYALRIRNMNRARVDLAIVSLTCPNVYWGTAGVGLRNYCWALRDKLICLGLHMSKFPPTPPR